MLAKDAMSGEISTLTPDATVLEAASLLVNTSSSAAFVVNERGGLAGIVSEADVMSRIKLGALASASSDGTSVAEIMTRDVISVEEDASLASAIELMLTKHLKVLPVCRQGAVVGVISRPVIVRLIVSQAAGDPVTTTTGQDEALRHNVLQAVKGRRWSLAQRFDVVVKDGAIHLWGVVPSDKVHASYIEAVERVPQARSVTSHMHVMPGGVRMHMLT
jgi:CBS domain-containing protein